MKKRNSPTDTQKEDLGEFYGQCCVVTGDTGAFEWHHLDDNESNGATENFLPLASNLNIYLRDKRKEASKGQIRTLRADLDPINLGKIADLLASIEWNYGRAYGCARLGAFISTNYLRGGPSVALNLACQAIYYARHQLSYSKIFDTLHRSVLPLLETRQLIAPSARYGIIREVAGVFAEHGRNKEAIELFVSLRSLKVESSSNPGPALRREATAIAGSVGITHRVMNLFAEAGRGNPEDRSHQVSVANSLAWLYICDGRYAQAIEVLEPVVAFLHKEIFRPGRKLIVIAISPWNAAEPFHNYALALSQVKSRGYKAKIEWAIDAASRLFQEAGSGLYIVRNDDSARHQKMLNLEKQYWAPRYLSDELVREMGEVIRSLALIPR